MWLHAAAHTYTAYVFVTLSYGNSISFIFNLRIRYLSLIYLRFPALHVARLSARKPGIFNRTGCRRASSFWERVLQEIPSAVRNYSGFSFYQPYGKKTYLALTCHSLACPRARHVVRGVFTLNLRTVNSRSSPGFNNMLTSVAWMVGYMRYCR